MLIVLIHYLLEVSQPKGVTEKRLFASDDTLIASSFRTGCHILQHSVWKKEHFVLKHI